MVLVGNLGGLLALICAVWVIYDVLTNEKGMDKTQRIIWIITAVLFNIITAIVYYLMKKR